MRKHSDILFKLIKSLSKSEKGYFLKYAPKDANLSPQYLKLFNIIDSQTHYDEEQIKEKFKDEPFVRQLHVAKNYLYNKLLRTLFLFNSKNSGIYKLAENIHSIYSLYDKGLHKECYSLIIKSKLYAFENEKYDNILELIRLQKILIMKFSPSDIAEKIDGLSEEEFNILKFLQNIVEYRNLYGKIYSKIKLNGSIRSESEKNEYLKIINDSLMLTHTNALCYESKILYYLIKFIYSQAESDDNGMYEFSMKAIKEMEKLRIRLSEFSREYVLAMVGYLSAAFNLGKYTESLSIIRDLRNYPLNNFELQQYIFFSTALIEILIKIEKCEFDKGKNLIPDIEKGLKKFGEKEPKAAEIILYGKIFYIYFGMGEYENALKWINKILNIKFSIRKDVYSISLICNLLVHFELKNIDLLRYAVINAYRFLYKSKKLYKFENIVIKFIRRLPNAKDLNYEFVLLKKEFKELLKDPYERIPLEYFDFISWLDSKINDKSFIETKKSNKWKSS